MLLSVIKILAFVVAVTAATFGAAQLMDVSGGAEITIAGIELTLSPLELTIGFVVLIVLVWGVLKLLGLLMATLRFINGDETAISRYLNRSRERRGFEALSEGMMALASGEGATALAKASRAERYLDRPDLTNLLTAQAAELAGDRKKAEETYRKLLKDDKTRFVGVRGIMKQRLEDGDTDAALQLAKKAFEIKPKHEETQDVLLRLQAESHDWAGARRTLGQKLKSGHMPRELHRRRDAILAVSEAKDILDENKTIEAREAAIEANRLSPDLIPAAAMAARGYIEAGNARYAARVIKKAWSVEPHPDLASAFAEIAPDEKPEGADQEVFRPHTHAPGQPRDPAASDRTEPRGRGFPRSPARPWQAGRGGSDIALAYPDGRDRARRGVGRRGCARLVDAGTDGPARAAMGLRQLPAHPCHLGSGLQQLPRFRHAVVAPPAQCRGRDARRHGDVAPDRGAKDRY